MSVEEKREKVLELIYEEMAHKSNFSYDKTLADVVKSLESARLADQELAFKKAEADTSEKQENRDFELKEKELALKEKEFELKDALALTDNANAEMDRAARKRELIVTSCITAGQAILWGLIFVHELSMTRKFEETGTELSAASRWLKNSFPKVRLF